MSSNGLRVLLAAAAASAIVVGGLVNTASATNSPPPYLDEPMLITFDDMCPGFAPFIPGDPVASDGTMWWAGYFSFPPGEYLWFSGVQTNPGGDVFRTEGSGVPSGYPGWMPTSDHTYKLTGKRTSEGVIFDSARLNIVRDDGATVSGDVQIQHSMNHGELLTGWSQLSCRLH
jgi:hypothetical protein